MWLTLFAKYTSILWMVPSNQVLLTTTLTPIWKCGQFWTHYSNCVQFWPHYSTMARTSLIHTVSDSVSCTNEFSALDNPIEHTWFIPIHRHGTLHHHFSWSICWSRTAIRRMIEAKNSFWLRKIGGHDFFEIVRTCIDSYGGLKEYHGHSMATVFGGLSKIGHSIRLKRPMSDWR